MLDREEYAPLQVWDLATGARLLALESGAYVPTVGMADEAAYLIDDNCTSFGHPTRDAAPIYSLYAHALQGAPAQPWQAAHGAAHGVVYLPRKPQARSFLRCRTATGCVSPDGQYAAYASGDTTVRVVRLVDATCLYELEAHRAEVTILAFAALRNSRGTVREGLVSTAMDGSVCFSPLQLDGE